VHATHNEASEARLKREYVRLLVLRGRSTDFSYPSAMNGAGPMLSYWARDLKKSLYRKLEWGATLGKHLARATYI